jgi:arginyl-tRNA synthetase
MPGPGHQHSAKMERCLEDLKAKGHDAGSAHAICYTSLGNEANKVEKGGGTEECPICAEIAKLTIPAHKGSIIAKDQKRRYTLGIVYAPDELDTDEEFTDAAELEKAAWDFMRELQGRSEMAKLAMELVDTMMKSVPPDGEELDVEVDVSVLCEEIAKRGVNAMHLEDLEDAEVVESYIAPVDMEIDGQKIAKGTWLCGIVWGEEHFKKIEAGEWTGYSMGGFAHREKNAD